MDPPWLDIPKATYQPAPHGQQNPNSDVEQQAGLSASNPGPQNQFPSGQNSVRTRVYSGLLMLTVIAIIVIILVSTSVRHVKPSKHH